MNVHEINSISQMHTHTLCEIFKTWASTVPYALLVFNNDAIWETEKGAGLGTRKFSTSSQKYYMIFVCSIIALVLLKYDDQKHAERK